MSSIRTGQSIIELLIAVGAIGMVLVALVSTATRAVSMQTFSRIQSQATKRVEEQLERVRAFRDQQGLSALACPDRCAIAVNSPPLVVGPTIAVGELSIWFEVATSGSCPTPPVGITAMKEVIAYAAWTDQRGAHQSKVVECLSDWR